MLQTSDEATRCAFFQLLLFIAVRSSSKSDELLQWSQKEWLELLRDLCYQQYSQLPVLAAHQKTLLQRLFKEIGGDIEIYTFDLDDKLSARESLISLSSSLFGSSYISLMALEDLDQNSLQHTLSQSSLFTSGDPDVKLLASRCQFSRVPQEAAELPEALVFVLSGVDLSQFRVET